MQAELPMHQWHMGAESPECPWCKAIMDDFAPLWSDVVVIVDPEISPHYALVSADGDCPECGKPVRVVEHRSGNSIDGHTEGRLTQIDERYLALKAAPNG